MVLAPKIQGMEEQAGVVMGCLLMVNFQRMAPPTQAGEAVVVLLVHQLQFIGGAQAAPASSSSATRTPTVCNDCGTDYYYNGSLCISCPTGSNSPPGATTSCKCPANYHRKVDGGVYSCAACTQGATRPAGDTVPGGTAATCAGSSGSSPASPTQGKEEKKKQAEKTRDSILGDITNTRLKAKAKLLADAAIAGVKVKRLKAKLTADSEDTACSDAFTKAGMSASDGACVATAASSRKRRSLSSTTYDVELMFSSSTVSDDALAAAELEMKNNGVEGVSSDTAVDPIAELKTVPGVDTSKLQTFETEASDAAEAAAESAAPPPAPPPPKAKPGTRRR